MNAVVAPKSFADADKYSAEIRVLVPGYDLMQSLLPLVLGERVSAARARLVVVGCGPGHELVAMAQAHPEWTIDAVDPEAAMVASARTAIDRAGVGDRVKVQQGTAALIAEAEAGAVPFQRYDAALACLVGHVIPDNGEREAFLVEIASCLRPGACAALVELVDDGTARRPLTEMHLSWSRAAGAPEDRIPIMRERLLSGFHALPRRRLDTLLRRAGLRVAGEFFRCFGVVGLLLEKRPAAATR